VLEVLALPTSNVGAQTSMSTADHPLMGMWLAMANSANRDSSPIPAPSLFAAHGSVILSFVPADIRMDGALLFSRSALGVWEPFDEQTGHFTAVQTLADSIGKLIGSVTIDGHPKVSEDGTTWSDDGSLVMVTIRDVGGQVVNVVPPGIPGKPVTGIKMRVGNAGFSGEEDATSVP